MPESIKIRVELDTASARQELSDLQKAFKALGGFSGPLGSASFMKNNPHLAQATAQAMGMSYASAGSGGQRYARYASSGGTSIDDYTFEYQIERETQKRGRRGRGGTQQMADAMSQFERGLTKRLRGLEWNFPGNPGGYPSNIYRPPDSDAELRKGAKTAMGMGPLRTGTDWRAAGIGGLTAMFSPWLGARMLNQTFGGFPGGGGVGGGKGGGSGLLGAMFGGGTTGFAEWYLLIRTINLLNKAFHEMIQTIHKGSELYRQAAATGTSTQRLAHVQAALGGIGMPPEVVNRMIQQTQFGRGGRITTTSDLIMRAHMGAGGMGDAQQIMNMRKELDYLLKETAFGAKIIGDAAASMNRLNMQMSILKTDWQAFWNDITKTMELPLRFIINLGDMILRGFHNLTAWIPQLWEKVIKGILGEKLGQKFLNALFPFPAPGGGKIGGTASVRPESSWEKMGLIINGGIMGRDYARQTAENTKRIADHVTKMFGPVQQTWGEGQPNFNLP